MGAIMTKKHFVAMAEEFRIILNNINSTKTMAVAIESIEAFMRVAASINGRFDKGRFRKACGLSG
jgi:hypothetical protein